MTRLVAVATLIAVFSANLLSHQANGLSPCNAGFTVKKSTAGTSTVHGFTGVRISFHDVLTNVGGWFDNDSEFIAPCSGEYYFSFHGVAPDGDRFVLALMKNDQQQKTSQGGGWALLRLNRNDRVHLKLQQGSLDERFDQAYTTFSGFLVKRR